MIDELSFAFANDVFAMKFRFHVLLDHDVRKKTSGMLSRLLKMPFWLLRAVGTFVSFISCVQCIARVPFVECALLTECNGTDLACARHSVGAC